MDTHGNIDPAQADALFRAGSDHIRHNRYGDAAEAFAHARTEYSHLGQELMVAACECSLGFVTPILGQFVQSRTHYQQALEIYLRNNFEGNAAFCEQGLGDVAANLCDFELARTHYQNALTIYLRNNLEHEAANCERRLGDVAANLGDFEQARTYFQNALTIYRHRNLGKEAADCEHKLGDVAANRGDFEQARTHYEKALQTLEMSARPDFEDDAADYERNLGAITTALGRFEVARSHFQKASEIYLRLQIDHDAAWCQHNIGSIWWHVASAADPVEHPVLLRRALRWLVPATVFLEGMRFQFTAAADRVAWARRIERSTRSLFEVATELGDEVLVADLIESAINAGVHTTASGDDMLSARAVGVFAGLTDLRETGQRLTSEVASTITGAGSSRHRENTGGQNSPDARGIHLGGTSRLIAGARLPMRPPPRLRMPDAHLALEPWTITYPGAHDYPPLQRSPQEIAIT